MLKYKGMGFLEGIPARDLTDREVALLGGEPKLTKSGLYYRNSARVEKPIVKKNKKEVTHGKWY